MHTATHAWSLYIVYAAHATHLVVFDDLQLKHHRHRKLHLGESYTAVTFEMWPQPDRVLHQIVEALGVEPCRERLDARQRASALRAQLVGGRDELSEHRDREEDVHTRPDAP